MRDNQQLRVLGVAVLMPAFIAFALTMFAWPNANLAPRDLPLGLVGPAQARSRLATHLQAATASGFDLHVYTDEIGARSAIMHRDIYGAIELTLTGPKLLVASAAGPVVVQMLTQVYETGVLADGAHGAASHQSPNIVDVVPAAAKDPRGAALSSSVLPLVISGAVTAVLITLLILDGAMQAAALVISSCLGGAAAVGVAQTWLGVVRGDWWANAGALALMILATAGAIAGLKALLGRPGLALGVLLMVFVGNPLSAVSSAPELLPSPEGAIGQLLPAGAGGSLLRSTAFFGGNGAGVHLAVLSAWIVFGMAAIAFGALRNRRAVASKSAISTVDTALRA
jgi:hypothetical protein